MERKLTQKELKEALQSSFELSGAYAEKITFKTGIDENDKPKFNGADITFKEGSNNMEAGKVYHYEPGEVSILLNRMFNEDGLTAANENNVGPVDIRFEMGSRMVSGTPIPVFRGVTAQVHEYDRSVDMYDEDDEEEVQETINEDESIDEQKKDSMQGLADIRRQEHVESLGKLDDRDLVDMVAAHFESHPALPGEKNLKDMANKLAQDAEWGSVHGLDAEARADMIRQFADTRVRETKMDSINKDYDVTALKMEPMAQDGTVSMKKMDVELQRMQGNVYVLAPLENGSHITIGKLPEKFLTNNPMNVESCGAEMQVTDYSNGKMKNVSMRVVVDTDLMSGDVIDLDESMFETMDDGLQR